MRIRDALTVLVLLTTTGPVWAAGLEIPEQGVRSVSRGGAFSAKANDPTAALHNPGALSKLRGPQLIYSHNLLWHNASFTRAESQIPAGTSYEGQDPLAKVENESPFFGLGALFAASHDFGLEDWTFAFSVYGPNYTGHVKYPETGGQRYMLTELDTLVLFNGLSVAWGKENFGVGTTLQWAWLPRMRYSLVVDGQPGGSLNPYASATDTVATLNISDPFAFTAQVGAWWRPIDEIEIAVSGRVLPVRFEAEGDFELKNVPGQTQYTDDLLTVPGASAKLEITLPPTARLGVRYRNLDGTREKFDVEFDVVYEAWSMVDAYDADLEGTLNAYGGFMTQDVTLPKRWRDTFSFRLGGTANVIGDLSLSAGGYYEQGASHRNYTALDFMSLERVGVGGGLAYALGDPDGFQADLLVSYQHVFQEDRDVPEQYGKVMQQRPIAQCPDGCGGLTGVPANAGHFESSFDTLSFGVHARF
ncbi:MAG: outer membrane protein transport protein [Myxococcales bacterium]|nr:outer membrane protein transport protein [Myxococcales bacterium]